jgi:type II secretory pathway component GspD/PulD (secretin)
VAKKKIKSKAEPKKVLLEVSEITRKGLTTIKETIQIGPESNYDNAQKKPRREIQSSISILTKPDFPISISFKNTNLSDALLALGNLGGKNILVDNGVNGFVTLNVNNEPWNKVFNSIIEMKNLSYKGSPSDSIIKIYGGSNNTSNVKSNEIFNIYYEKPSELKKQIENLFADSGNSTIINANDENKTLIVQSSVSQINEIEKIINKIDVKKAQILIEAFLLEVKPTFEKKLGTRI